MVLPVLRKPEHPLLRIRARDELRDALTTIGGGNPLQAASWIGVDGGSINRWIAQGVGQYGNEKVAHIAPWILLASRHLNRLNRNAVTLFSALAELVAGRKLEISAPHNLMPDEVRFLAEKLYPEVTYKGRPSTKAWLSDGLQISDSITKKWLLAPGKAGHQFPKTPEAGILMATAAISSILNLANCERGTVIANRVEELIEREGITPFPVGNGGETIG